MRVLQVVKTSDGASWAANQVELLVRSGIEVHVALPSEQGRTMSAWRDSGAQIHIADLSLPLRQPNHLPARLRTIRRLVDEVQPDLIHSHFVTNTLALRLALGKSHKIPRIFQVPGPLHLEHWHTRQPDLLTAGDADYWVGSSRCIVEHYRRSGVPDDHVFLSYYGWPVEQFTAKRNHWLNDHLDLPRDTRLIGNINIMYPPKRLLGQHVGLKCHEDVIEALGVITRMEPDTRGVLIGDSYGLASWYEAELRKRAQRVCGEKIIMPGLFSSTDVALSWPDFDCAIHVPLSENCGGVIEPLLAGVPVVASDVGGIPEIVVDGVTGRLVPRRNPAMLAEVVLDVLNNIDEHRAMAAKGGALVRQMFSRSRTVGEVIGIYNHILIGASRPPMFEAAHVAGLAGAIPSPSQEPVEVGSL